MSHALPIVDCLPSSLGENAGFGCLRGPAGALPLAAFSADCVVAGPVWRWRLRQTFVNQAHDVIEAVYIFPLPARAAVSAFRLRVAGRLVEGDLRERGAAREAYQQAIAVGKRAALLEEDRPDVFTIQVGNIRPGEHAEVELELSGPVTIEDGVASMRLPLVVAPRYIPGRALGDDVGLGTAGDTDAVPDASRISPPVLLPGFPNPVRLDISLAISGVDLDGLGCSLPTVADGIGRWRVLPGQRLDRDCIVRWPARGAALDLRALLAGSAADGGCTLAVSIIPPAGLAASPKPRDVVVLLDRSGSMGGWKMVAARRAAARLIDALDVRDRFAALAFDNSVEGHDGVQGGLHPATDRARFAAVSWLARIEARGGTELTGALDRAFALLSGTEDDRERILVLVTDAQIGDEDHLLKRHAAALRRTRVIALGIDQAVNEGLLERLVAPNGGWQACVESEDWLDRVLAVAARMVQPAALADIVVETAEGSLPACTPDPLSDAWYSRPLTLWSRLPQAPSTVTVRGVLADGSPWRSEVAVETLAEPALHQAWARGRIRDLEDRYAVAASTELSAEIVAVSLRERVLSRFTAFVAVDHEVSSTGQPRSVVQAVETPAGWDTSSAAACHSQQAQYEFMAVAPSPAPSSRKVSEKREARRMGLVNQNLKLRDVVSEEGLAESAPPALSVQARALLDRIAPLAGDRMRLALALRAARTGQELRQLSDSLASEAALAKRLEILIGRMAKPATMEVVAACWDELRDLLIEITALVPVVPPAPEAVPGPSKRFRFWA